MTGLVDIGGDQWVNPSHVTAVYRQPDAFAAIVGLGDRQIRGQVHGVAEVVARLNGSFVPDPQATETAGEDARRDSPAENATTDGLPPRLPSVEDWSLPAPLHPGVAVSSIDEARIQMVHDLHRAVHGDTWARPESPSEVWRELLCHVEATRPRLPTTVDAIDDPEVFLGGAPV